jgi:hypothetical protein
MSTNFFQGNSECFIDGVNVYIDEADVATELNDDAVNENPWGRFVESLLNNPKPIRIRENIDSLDVPQSEPFELASDKEWEAAKHQANEKKRLRQEAISQARWEKKYGRLIKMAA